MIEQTIEGLQDRLDILAARTQADADPHGAAIGQAEALKSARKHKGWSQRRLAAALEQAARALGQLSDLPPAGRQTLIQYISYFENGKRPVPERLWPIFREALQCTGEDLGFAEAAVSFGAARPPDLPAAHLQSSGSAVISSLQRILATNIRLIRGSVPRI